MLMQDTITLGIADDHEIFRDGLSLMLSRQPNFLLCCEAEDGRELVKVALEKKPDIILTDIKMPRMDGIAATHEILKQLPDTKIIALSMSDEENMILEMLEAGAKGYLLKNADKNEVIDAIEEVYKGNNYYCRSTSTKLARMIVKSKFNQSKKKEEVSFSDREKEIIVLICKQYTAKQIGEVLFLSNRTVEGYRTKILEKMNVKNSVGVVMYALSHDLIKENEIAL
jgi:two-component system, NarL family, response regulator NreC